jgi:hypothetical protein
MTTERQVGTVDQIEKHIVPQRRYELFYDIALGIQTYKSVAEKWNAAFAGKFWAPVTRRTVALWWRREFLRSFPTPTAVLPSLQRSIRD